jgi:hypothetical protein
LFIAVDVEYVGTQVYLVTSLRPSEKIRRRKVDELPAIKIGSPYSSRQALNSEIKRFTFTRHKPKAGLTWVFQAKRV